MYINGEWITNAEKTFPVFNPATGEKIGEVADGNATHANTAIEAAHTAFQTWSKTTAYQRSRYLYDAYGIMMENKEHLARTMTEEQGKPFCCGLPKRPKGSMAKPFPPQGRTSASWSCISPWVLWVRSHPGTIPYPCSRVKWRRPWQPDAPLYNASVWRGDI
jgi:hypothetical protein